MKEQRHHLISIIPFVHISSGHETVFTYTSKEPLPLGSLVEIPFGKRKVNGITIEKKCIPSEKKDPAFLQKKTLKNISALLIPSLLTSKQIALALWIAQEYFISPGVALQLFLPSFSKKTSSNSLHSNIRKQLLPKKKEHVSFEKITLTSEQQKAVNILLHTKKPILLTGNPSSGKTEVAVETAKQILQQKKQVLFLFPEIALTPHTVERLQLRLGEKTVRVFHSALSPTEQARVRNDVASGTPCIVTGSRSALFLPFQNLGLVVIDEEHDDGHKQSFRAPRFDARRVAKKIARLHNAILVKSTSTPSCEVSFEASEKIIRTVTLPPAQKRFSVITDPNVITVDMRLLHWQNKQKRLSPPVISNELRELLAKTLRNKSQAILLVSRQGMNAFSLCTQCKNIFRCPKCERALVGQRSGHFLCLGGHFRTPAFPKCPHCGGISFAGHGLGTQKTEEIIARLFPSARIARADAQTFRKKSLRADLFKNMTSRKIDILIGTQMIAKGWNLPHLACVAVIDTDTFFSFPDFSNDARTAQLFFQARGRLGRIGNAHKGTLLLQTYRTDRPLFDFLKKNDYAGFLREESETRKALGYPPFSRLIRIFGKNKNDTLLRTQALELFKNLVRIVPEAFIVSRPAKSLKREKPGIFCRHIILKCPSSDIPESLRQALETLPKNWYVDRDPLSIL